MNVGGETLNRFFLTNKGLPSALEVPCFAFVVLRKQFNFQSAVKRSMIFLFVFVSPDADLRGWCLHQPITGQTPTRPNVVIISQLQAISQLFSSYLPSGKFCLVSELNIHIRGEIIGRKSLGVGRQDICKDKECNLGPVAGYYGWNFLELYFCFACMFTFEGNIQCAKEGSQPWNALMLINMTVFTVMPLRW